MRFWLLALGLCRCWIQDGEVCGAIPARTLLTECVDLVAALGETTAGPSLPRLRDVMLESAEGRQILRDRPRINTTTVDLKQLAQLPEGTFGRSYVTWLERCGVTPDTRAPVCHLTLTRS